jgi:hypothetical protein
MIKLNELKSEHPLCGRGVLLEARAENHNFDLQSKIDVELPIEEEKRVRKTWDPPTPIDQGKYSCGVGAAIANYLQCKGVEIDMEMEPLDFAKAIYHESQAKDQWPGTERQGYYGTSLMQAMVCLKEKDFFQKVLWTDNTAELSNHVLYNGPAIVAAPWFSEMSRIDPNGFARPSGVYEGPHCWLVYGVDDLWETFFALNSWGKEYGKEGKFLVKFSDMDKLLSVGYAVASQ